MGKSKLYTGGGDKGMTSLVGGFRVPKTHPRLEAYGTIDELNSFIGLLIQEIEETQEIEAVDETGMSGMTEFLLYIQGKLFTVGSYLSTDPSKTEYRIESRVTTDNIAEIETKIDQIDSELPKLKAFVLPGGSRAAALAHVCRTVCRRAERAICRLAETDEVEEPVFIFINRMSDFLFVLARKLCLLKKGEEFFWNNTCK